MLKKLNPFIVLIILIPLALCIVWFKDGKIMAGGESGLTFYNPDRKFELSHLSWSEIGLGSALRNGVTAAPTYWVFAKMNAIGLPNFLVQAIYFYFLYVASGLSIYFLTKTIFPTIQPRFIFISTLFYWFNLFSLVNIWNRFLYDFMSLWAYLPLATYLFVYGIKKRKPSFAILLTLSSVLFSFGLSNIAFLLLLWFVLFSFFMFSLLSYGQKIFTVYYFLITIISFVFFNFWWISHAILFRTNSYFEEYISGFFAAVGNLDTLSILSEKLGNVFYTSRLMHGTFFNEGPVWAKLFESPPISLLSYLPPILTTWVVVKFRRIKEVSFLGLSIIFLLFLIKGTNKPLGEIFEFFFVNFPILQVFRNPFEKFGVLLPLYFSPLIAFGLYKLSSLLSNKYQTVFYTIIIFYMFAGSFPFWTGLVFTRKDLQNQELLQSYQTQVPNYYKQANEWLKKDPEVFRLIVFPIGGEGLTQTWEVPYSGIESSSLFFAVPAVSLNTSIPFYSEIASSLDRLLYQRSDFENIASILNVKYLTLRKDINWQASSMRNPADLENLFQKRNYQKETQFGNLSLYHINENNFQPKIWASTSLVSVNGKMHIEDFFLSESKPKDAIYSEKNYRLPGTKKVLIKPEQASFFPEIKKYTHKEALDNLPFAKYLPDHPIYPLIQLKETLGRTRNKNTPGKFLYDLANLGKKAAEINGLAQKKNFSQSAKSLDNYLALVSKFEEEFPDKIILSPENEFLDLLLKSLISQRIVILQALDTLQLKEKYQSSLDSHFIKLGLLFNSFPLISDQKNFWIYRFNLLETGDYNLVLEGANLSFLLDGRPNKKTVNNFFEKGDHEIVVFNSNTKPVLVKSIEGDSWAPPLVSFEKINSTEYKVKIKSAHNPFLLIFSELYSSGWQFVQNDGKVIDERKHLLVNAYANGWFLDKQSLPSLGEGKKGDFEGVIKYTPQDYVNFGYKISLVSIGLGILLLKIVPKFFSSGWML